MGLGPQHSKYGQTSRRNGAHSRRTEDSMEQLESNGATPDSTVNNTYSTRLARFVELTLRKRELDAESKELDGELDALGGEDGKLLDDFFELGASSVKTPSGTVYINSMLWAGAKEGEGGASDYPATCEALIAAGLGDFVQNRFNAQTVSSWLRELPLDEEMNPVLPEVLRGNLKVSRVTKLRFRAAPRRGS